MSKKHETRKCKLCGIEHSAETIKRKFGEESSVYLLGYCSAQCLTKHMADKESEATQNQAIQKLAEACCGTHGWDSSGVQDAVSNFRDVRGEYPKNLPKPIWKDSFTSKDADAFGKLLAQWETNQAEVEAKRKAWNENEAWHNRILRRYIEIITGYGKVPEQYRSKIWDMAWEDGHSDGWVEVYYKLKKLVGIFID